MSGTTPRRSAVQRLVGSALVGAMAVLIVPGCDQKSAVTAGADPPVSEGEALRLPYFSRGLTPAQRYFVDTVDPEVRLTITTPAEVVAGSQEESVAWFGDPNQSPAARHYVMTILAADGTVANPDPALDPYTLVGPDGIEVADMAAFLSGMRPLPMDAPAWLAAQPYVTVVTPPRSADVGGRPARVVDVRARDGMIGIRCPDGTGTCAMPFAHARYAFPVVISSEYVTRIIDLDVAGRRLLLAADLGTAGEALLTSLEVSAA